MNSFLRKISHLILELLKAAWDSIKNHKIQFYVRKEVTIVTKNELEFQRLQQDKKLREQELAETKRSNLTRESETARANRMAEAQKISPFYALAYSIWPDATEKAKAKANQKGPANLVNNIEAIYTSLSGTDMGQDLTELRDKVKDDRKLQQWFKDYIDKHPEDYDRASKMMEALEKFAK